MSLNFDRALLQKTVTREEYIKLYAVIMLCSYSDLLQMNTVGKNNQGLFSVTHSWAALIHELRAATLEIQYTQYTQYTCEIHLWWNCYGEVY